MNAEYLYVGAVYSYTLMEDCQEKGYIYIGETQNEQKRKYDWQESKNTSYGGKRITDARSAYGTNTTCTWFYEVLEYVYANNVTDLKIALVETEKYYINLARRNGEHLFNGNNGGKGR